MIRIILGLVLMVSATAGLAQSAVRSGEHPTFTRLVIPILPGATWTLGRGAGGYLLRLDPAGPPTRLDMVFSRIPRDRLNDLQQVSPSDLALTVGCDCHAEAFLWQSDKLVLDIVDGPASDPRFEARMDAGQAAPTTIVTEGSVLPLVFDTAPGDGPAPPEATATDAMPTLPEATVAALDRKARIDAIASGIIESLGRASSQGLLEPAIREPSPRTTPLDQAAPSNAENSPGGAGSPSPVPAIPFDIPGSVPAPGFRVQTSIDRDRPLAGPADAGVTVDGGGCLPDSDFDINSWGDETDFATQIAARRSMLTEEFDLMPDGAVEDLARTYLYFGFGREALQALGLDNRRSRERDILGVLATVMDGDLGDAHSLRDQVSCDGAVALWAFLAERGAIGGRPFDPDAIRKTFLSLPDALRAHLGPALASALIASGHPEAARQILEKGDPQAVTDPSEARVLKAEIDVQQGASAAAMVDLASLAQNDPRLTPNALAGLFELALSERRSVTPDLMLLSQSLRFEYRDDPATPRLALAETRILAASGDYEAAFALAADPLTRITPESRAAVRSDIMAELTRSGDDPVFLRHALGAEPFAFASEVENAMAARLVALGFPEQAQTLVSGPAEGDAMTERRYLRAEAGISLGQPDKALETLAGLTDPRADALRLAATATAPAMADPTLSNLVAPGDAGTGRAWRDGAWSDLAASDDPLLRSAAEAMARPSTPPSLTPSLKESEAALVATEESSKLIDELLTRFAVPAESAPGL